MSPTREFRRGEDVVVIHESGRPDGRLPATFQIVTMTAWAPHASQQQALTPGSARTRLADALKLGEI